MKILKSLLLVLIFCFVSCKKTKETNGLPTKNISVKQQTFNIDKQGIITKLPDSLKEKYDDNLFNKKLVGLGVLNENEKDIYKKYEIDFYHLCYGPAFSFFIDVINHNVYVYEYDEYDILLSKIQIRYVLKINEIQLIDKGYSLKIKNGYEVIDGNKLEQLKFNDISLNLNNSNSMIYSVSITHDYDNYFSNIFRYTIYANKEEEQKFARADCGDFDG